MSEFGESTDEANAIVIVSYTASIVDVASDVEQCVPWYLILGVQEQFEHGIRCFEIRIVELVANVPPEWPELSPFLDNGVEECEGEEKLSPDLWLQAVFKVLLRKVAIASLEVGSHSSRWLGCQLHRVLENGDWEVFGWHRSQKESEVFVDVVFLLREVQDNLLELRHPRFCQVTVLEHDP